MYAKDIDRAKTGLEPRTEKMNSRFSNPDNDPKLDWDDGDATAASGTEKDAYGIQSPFTGEMIYPGTSFWRLPKATMKALLESWGSDFGEYAFCQLMMPILFFSPKISSSMDPRRYSSR